MKCYVWPIEWKYCAGNNSTMVSKSFLLTNLSPERLCVSFFCSVWFPFNIHEGIHTMPAHGQIQLLVGCRQGRMLWRHQSWLSIIPVSFLLRWMLFPCDVPIQPLVTFNLPEIQSDTVPSSCMSFHYPQAFEVLCSFRSTLWLLCSALLSSPQLIHSRGTWRGWAEPGSAG